MATIFTQVDKDQLTGDLIGDQSVDDFVQNFLSRICHILTVVLVRECGFDQSELEFRAENCCPMNQIPCPLNIEIIDFDSIRYCPDLQQRIQLVIESTIRELLIRRSISWEFKVDLTLLGGVTFLTPVTD